MSNILANACKAPAVCTSGCWLSSKINRIVWYGSEFTFVKLDGPECLYSYHAIKLRASGRLNVLVIV